jgi:flagellar assembly factor FliW
MSNDHRQEVTDHSHGVHHGNGGTMGLITVASSRFGEFPVSSDIVLHFAQGMIGFPSHRDYVLIKQRDDSVFMWLHSMSDPSLAFPVVLPWAFHWQYEVKLSDDDLASISITEQGQISILAVVNVGSDVRSGTINLFSPIVINNDTREAKQVINTAQGYSTRDALFTERAQPTPVAMHDDESLNVAVIAQAA